MVVQILCFGIISLESSTLCVLSLFIANVSRDLASIEVASRFIEILRFFRSSNLKGRRFRSHNRLFRRML